MPLLLNRDELKPLLDLNKAIELIEDAHRQQANGQIVPHAPYHIPVGGRSGLRVVSGALLKNQRDNVKRFLQALIEGIYTFKAKPEVARTVLRESNGEAEVTPLYERLTKSFRDFPSPENRGIQNVIDSLPTPKARGAKAEDFMDSTLMDEIRKSGFAEKLSGK